jgi:hypothetical protein
LVRSHSSVARWPFRAGANQCPKPLFPRDAELAEQLDCLQMAFLSCEKVRCAHRKAVLERPPHRAHKPVIGCALAHAVVPGAAQHPLEVQHLRAISSSHGHFQGHRAPRAAILARPHQAVAVTVGRRQLARTYSRSKGSRSGAPTAGCADAHMRSRSRTCPRPTGSRSSVATRAGQSALPAWPYCRGQG